MDNDKISKLDAMSLSTKVEVENGSEAHTWQYIRILLFPVATADNLTRNCAIWSVRIEESRCEVDGKRSALSKMYSADQARADLTRRRYVISADKLNMWKQHMLSLAFSSRGRVKVPSVAAIGTGQEDATRQFLMSQVVEMQWLNTQMERCVEAQSIWNLTAEDHLLPLSSPSPPSKPGQRVRAGQQSPRVSPRALNGDPETASSSLRMESLRSRQYEVMFRKN
jgi:hypothetical protein